MSNDRNRSLDLQVPEETYDQLTAESRRAGIPILITGKRTNAVLVSEDDWRSIQETLHLVSIPGMRESILGGLSAPIESCIEARTLKDLEQQMQEMSEDLDVQREIAAINRDFEATDADALDEDE